MKNGPRVWAFCKIEFPGIQKPVQFFDQKSCFFRNLGNRGVGVIWLVRGGCFDLLVRFSWWVLWLVLFVGFVVAWLFVDSLIWLGGIEVTGSRRGVSKYRLIIYYKYA